MTTTGIVTHGIEHSSDVVKMMADYGVAFTFSAVALVVGVAMIFWFLKRAEKSLNVFTTRINDNIDRLLTENQHQTDVLNDLVEGLRTETQLRIRNLSGFAFDLSMEQVSRMLKKVREQNHISDKQATAVKIRNLLQVIHDDRNSRFDPFTYHGKPLSHYCDQSWVEEVAKVVEGELYHVEGANNARAWSNIQNVYGRIKTEFYKKLNN